MKKSFRFPVLSFSTLLALIAILTQSFTSPSSITIPIDNHFPPTQVIVKQGLVVMFELNANFSSDEVEVGRMVSITLTDPIIVDGKEVASEGSVGFAKISKVTRLKGCRECEGKYQKIEIKVDKVKAVDGQWITLSGTPAVFKGECPYCPVDLEQGVPFEGRVRSTVRITPSH